MALLDAVVETPPRPSAAAPLMPASNGSQGEITYPESDGQPMADNTKQFRYIVTIQGGLAALFAEEPNVFVAGDLLWYPVEGNNRLRVAPDVMAVFGRPKGDRGAYLQWQEGGIAPQVVFEILSPGNTIVEMSRKLQLYDLYGVEEYYLYDPDRGVLAGWMRRAERLAEIERMEGWVSPRLGIRFGLEDAELVLARPDGRRFETFVELAQRADAERERAERLAERLRALGVDPASV